MQRNQLFILFGTLATLALCATGAFVVLGSGAALYFMGDAGHVASAAQPTRRPAAVVSLPTVTSTPTLTPLPLPTNTPLPTDTPTYTATPPPTDTPPPTATPRLPDTPTATATPAPPTATPLPTDTPIPTAIPYAFTIKESVGFDTSHFNFDVYVAVVDDNNKPLPDYRIIGVHSSGMQIESRPSARDWTHNSGAMHYKAGNIKYEVMNSPTGVWTLQLVTPDGALAAPPVEYAFDSNSPSWYFLIYERQ